jgi:hypothetical protein
MSVWPRVKTGPRMFAKTLTRRCLSPIVAVCCLTGGGPLGLRAFAGVTAPVTPAESPSDTLSRCERAGIIAEQAGGLPAGLLLAIGRVESGKWDSTRARMTAWPWTINAAGKGQYFESKDAATQTVKSLLDGGTRSIDVGCFQISLLYHPTAFASLEQAFDPDANARYAAGFLLNLFGRTGAWEAAVEAYHSADPALGFAYRKQVFATWLAATPINVAAGRPIPDSTTPRLALASMQRPAALPLVIAGVRIWTPMPAGTGGNVVEMPGTQLPPPAPGLLRCTATPLPAVSYRVLPAGLLPKR